MNSTRLILIVSALSLLSATGVVAGGVADRLWFGGGVGVGFGDVDFVAIEPSVGFQATHDLSVGLGLTDSYRNDQRFTPDLSTTPN